MASRLPDKTVLKGSTLASSGFALTTAGTRSRQYITWVYIGWETHSVPSWSKVARRASGGTNFGLALSVVAFTKSRIACLAGPSFQEGSGSWAWARAGVVKPRAAKNPMQKTTLIFLERFFPCILKSSLQP